jgi:hypothetical protein
MAGSRKRLFRGKQGNGDSYLEDIENRPVAPPKDLDQPNATMTREQLVAYLDIILHDM